jgi:hypothetical protein
MALADGGVRLVDGVRDGERTARDTRDARVREIALSLHLALYLIA